MRSEIKAIIVLLLFILLTFSFACNANKVNDTNDKLIPMKTKVVFNCYLDDFHIVGKLSDKMKPFEKYWELYLTSGSTAEKARKLSTGSACIACFYGPYVKIAFLKNDVVLIQVQNETIFTRKETAVKFKNRKVIISYITYEIQGKNNFEDDYGCGEYDEKSKTIGVWQD